jgi:hypothetical protein
MFVLFISLSLFTTGLYGVWRLEDGLELSDVLPKQTAAYEFIVAREEYFSFYPMNVIVRAPTDFAAAQNRVRQMRQDMLDNCPYTVCVYTSVRIH